MNNAKRRHKAVHTVELDELIKELKDGVTKMMSRYSMFAEKGVRNLISYNCRVDNPMDKLCEIVYVLSELEYSFYFKDTIEVNDLIGKIKQLGRAAGVYVFTIEN